MEHKLGILGLGNRSTLFYLNSINNYYNELNGGYSTCPYLLLNIDFNTINPFLPSQFDKTEPVLTSYIEQLLMLGVQKILIPNITLHETLDRINLFDQELFIHPLHLLKKELQLMIQKPAVILGTKHSMNNSYFNSLIEKEGIEVANLESRETLLVDEFRIAIYNNSESKELVEKFERLLAKLENKYTIVIACTELSAYLSTTKRYSKNTLDLAGLQIKEAVLQVNAL